MAHKKVSDKYVPNTMKHTNIASKYNDQELNKAAHRTTKNSDQMISKEYDDMDDLIMREEY